MFAGDVLAASQVGNGSSDFQYTVVSTGTMRRFVVAVTIE
jgi:hypothetical protein